MTAAAATRQNEPIAVIGSGCRFPGGINTPSRLWDELQAPRDLQREIPKDRFNIDAFYHPEGSHQGRTNARYAYTLSGDIHAFDASFFNIQPHEAEAIDPQQRLLLETVYEGIASAGLRMDSLAGSSTAVYVGMMTHDFETNKTHDVDNVPIHTATGMSLCIASNRVSYFFDWHGPSMTLDTACSSSLVAVHLAAQQLRSGSSKIAVAAGANLILDPQSKLNMLSPTGRSRMWDAAADGYARGEGVACVVLKTLSQAIQDGDTIECVIRETGVNQDGRTPGITMPNNAAQTALIRDTYARAGLDPEQASDKCQFFEAHGTGTPAGDPKEAEAISAAFFPSGQNVSDGAEPLYVGSIKTVIGHTEGTAGIAGLMKASLAVQHGIIPPNLLLENLNPAVAPFYRNLNIAKEARPWPALAPGQPRRASVNSFGFGGTNAHAIIENYLPATTGQLSATSISDLDSSTPQSPSTEPCICAAPLVFSAKSEKSLAAVLEKFAKFLRSKPQASLQHISSTLLSKLSVLNVRRAVTGAQTLEAACRALESEAASIRAKTCPLVTISEMKNQPAILGIFTGQGAQWPTMGKMLLSKLPLARDIVSELDHSLQALPAEYRPHWTIQEELMRGHDDSNVMKSEFSQPLCTAVQILLVQLLAAAGVTFDAVLGHSSGEIGCAYAAGFVTASEAIRIAYLRGMVTKHAASPSGSAGAMLAAGTSYEDAMELCALAAFKGRVCVAASNSSDSVTLSGDVDAIEVMKEVLEDESKFVRLLKVDRAYHSHHMLPCSSPYLEALNACGLSFNPSDEDGDGGTTSRPVWYSSVYSGKRMTRADVCQEYWNTNLVSPVFFSQALETALAERGSNLDAAIEIGPHPALKGPSLSAMNACLGAELPYTGCMKRSGDDVDAFAGALGYLWERFGSNSLNIAGLNAGNMFPSQSGKIDDSLVKQLPTYPWDHSRVYWSESRRTRAYLHGNTPHLLLGKISADSTASTLQWNNFIRSKDIDWLQGHGLQGQTVFPGAGYVIMAMEAALSVASDRPIQLLEVLGLDIAKAITFDDETDLVEFCFKATVVNPDAAGSDPLVLSFTIYSCLAKESNLSRSASGQLVVTFASFDSASRPLPSPQEEPPHMTKVNLDTFYKELGAIGYEYTREFRGIKAMRRVDGKVAGHLAFPKCVDGERSLVLHPATLDLSFQTVIAAYSSPGDKRLRSLHVPTRIERVALVPSLCASLYHEGVAEVCFNSFVRPPAGDAIGGDIEVFCPEDASAVHHLSSKPATTIFQVEGITFKPFTPPSAADDHHMFSKWVWGEMVPKELLDDCEYHATEEDRVVIPLMERIVYFYMRSFVQQLTDDDKKHAAPHHQMQMAWFEHILTEIRKGELHPWYEISWEADTHADVVHMCKSNITHPHVAIIHRIGENLADIIVHGIRNPFELINDDGLLAEFYANPRCFGPCLIYFQDLVGQIAHRYQHMNILEIGAGTGGATKYALAIPQFAYNSYTFTDVSSGFLAKAQDQFADFEEKMEFQMLDIRRNPEEQGFKPHSFDMIIASNVIHATPNLEATMAHVRSLLKPGGHVVVLELTHRKHSRLGFIFGLFPDWWAGLDDGRALEPFVSFDKWNDILKRTGFSGIDSRTLDRDATLFPNSCFSSHAVTSTIRKLDNPLSAPVESSYAPVVILGGASPRTGAVVEMVQKTLPHRQFTLVKHLKDIHDTHLVRDSTFLVLSEPDDALFSSLDEDNFEAIKTIFYYAAHALWVTENAWVKHPYQAMMIGLLRSLRLEHADVATQIIDVDRFDDLKTSVLVEQLLRLEFGANREEERLVWTQEPEIYVVNDRLLVPRLKHDPLRNDRLSSCRRPIFSDFDLERQTVSLCHAKDSSFFQSMPEKSIASSFVKVWVQFSLAKSIRIGNLGFCHLVQGVCVDTEKSVVAISQTNASTVEVPPGHVVSLDLEADHGHRCLLLPIAARLIANRIISESVPGTSVVIFEPPPFCVEAIAEKAKASNLTVKFTSLGVQPEAAVLHDVQWIQLHPRETERSLATKLGLATVSSLYDFSADQSPAGLGQRLSTYLPPTCSVYRVEDLVQSSATAVLSVHESERQMRDVSVAVAEGARTTLTSSPSSSSSSSSSSIPAADLAGLRQPWEISTVVDWKSSPTLAARIQPIDSGNLFVSSKTYLLVGLAGDLGRSLARWMIRHGARHIVLSSRNPQIDPRWLSETEDMGGNVLVLPMNVTDVASVDAALETITASGMPIIGGVAFGPLVLQDILFKNMDLEMMEMVLAPKVTGAQILNAKLADAPLDFFIMFSSIVMVLGNPGQSAYSAANAYMHALVQERRTQGLAGSTIDIGAVYGVGYVTRAGREEEFDAVRFLFDTVSEDELHALFAEAVVAGLPSRSTETDEDVEVITGMPFIDPTYRDRIPFFDDPRLGFYKLQDHKATTGDSATSKGSVKERLLQATTLDQVSSVVRDGLSERLRSTLQIAAEDSVDVETPLIDQGVDSLGAVTIGTWFSKQLNLDIPLLKVLGGASITDLAIEAAERLPQAAIPLVLLEKTGLDGSGSTSTEGGTSVDDNTNSDSRSQTEQLTAPDSPLTEMEDELVPLPQELKMLRSEKLSLNQRHSWTLQQQTDDPTLFNSTIGMFMNGHIDLNRLSKAVATVLSRHEIFRTCFYDGCDGPVQAVMSIASASNSFQAVQVADRMAAEAGMRQVESHRYDLAAGDTLKLVDFHWSSTNHLLVLGYSRLVGDGQTTENIFNEISQLYEGIQLPPPAQQYADFSLRQWKSYESGEMNESISFWETIHKAPVAVLPVMKVPRAEQRDAMPRGSSWEQHMTSIRLNPMVANRVKERSRKHKAQPLHFYLAAFNVLLARLTGSQETTVGVADINRPHLQDMSTMGYFANLLPVRMTYSASNTFGEQLIAAKEYMRAALQHSEPPCSIVTHRVQQRAQAPDEQAAVADTLFQAVFDYRQGQAESGTIGAAKITEVQATRERTRHDVVLEMSDDPTKFPLITLKLNRSLYGPEDVHFVANAYLAVLSIFSRNPALRVDEGRLDQPVKGAVA
ncbi:putative PKS/NRPS-like protein biosynthetic cluster [Claviceps pusilla]|uniref:PKS/NRPS-like protein biosynthetic cluster n=1 Tax=Claviceps pusilla TaxID=123648 RepID=A0A9P7NCD0_9HYPO|nr:putative PKS/NRPS-like protein biosynthetic cluster [Claviceps pusilla]